MPEPVVDLTSSNRAAALAGTYRLQMRTPSSDPDGRGFTLADACELVPYLADLGVGAVYLSPILKAGPGSTHGYDVVDPTVIEPELGGIDGLRALRAVCREHGVGVVVDIVPNHLGVEVASANPWWWDALRRGPESPVFHHFDFDTAPDNGCDGRIALPVLGSPQDVAALGVDRDGEEPVLTYYDHRFPIAPGTGDGTPQQVHDRQHYRLVHWREPLLGYRRFFTVTGLAGVRQEDREVFDATHAEVLRWCAEDLVDGVRVDHPDGLTDPVGYARRLRELVGEDRWIVVEKILAPGEVLDPAMPVDGTTGYDLIRLIDQVLLDPDGEGPLGALAARYCGEDGDESDVEDNSASLKREVVSEDLAPELHRLARAVRSDGGAGADAAGVDDDDLREALLEVISATPYYRGDYPVLRGTLPEILADVRDRRPELGPAIAVLGAALARGAEASARLAQVTGAATAKAEEDRLFYRLGRLVSLNEVGGSPGRFGMPVSSFHLAMAERARCSPLAMGALTTHDTKRGEDVRARISVLSQIPGQWAGFVESVFAACLPPETDAGYFLLQNVVGVWPAEGPPTETLRARLHEYADKALREAAVHTTWTATDDDFENDKHRWIDALIDDHAPMISEFVARIGPAGRDNALVAKALQLMVPGIPDVYQGTEYWEDSLVDPDNRRFVDYEPLTSGQTSATAHPKASLVRTALRLRRADPMGMAAGDHLPMTVRGPQWPVVIAFTRRSPVHGDVALVARCRTAVLDAEAMRGTEVVLPAGGWRIAPDGRVVEGAVDVADLLADSPVVLLTRDRPTA